MRTRRIVVGLLLSFFIVPLAVAGQLYRCAGDGVTTYSTHEMPGKDCKIITYSYLPAGWTTVSTSDGLVVSTHDQDVVRRKDDVKVWVMYSYTDNQEDRGSGMFYRSSKELDVYDCHSATVVTTTNVEYSGQNGEGKVMSSYQYKGATPTDIVPDTIGSAIYKKFCSLPATKNVSKRD